MALPRLRRFLLPLMSLLGWLAGSAHAGTWSIKPWTNDASMGLSSTDTVWAYHMGSATTATVSGVSIPGLAGPPPTSAAGKVEISGLQFVLNPDFNNLTSQTGTGSATIGSSFFYGGFPATITVKSGAGSLQPGLTYRVSFFSVGWDDAPGLRLIKFVSGSDELPADQAMYGQDNGLRTDYDFIAGAGDQVINVQMNNATNRTYHFYAVALTKVNYPTQVALTSSINPSQPGQNVTFTATVTATGAPGTPTGTVTFLNGGSPIGSPVALDGSGVAVLNTNSLPTATHSITASYSGAGDYSASTSNLVSQAVAGIFTVTSTADSGPGSLRDTVAATPAGSAIQFSAAVEGKPILLTSGEIVLNKNLLIDAASYAPGAITILGNETNRLLYVAAGASVEFRNLTFSGGGGVGAANTDRGGAVLNAGSLICTDCRFTGNNGVFGGAIATGYSTGNATLILRRCWIFDNVATGGGGGVTQVALANGLTSQLTMEECTVEDNRAGGGGGGVYNQVINGTVNASLRQCTIRGNTAVSNAAGGGGIFSRSGGITSIASLTLTHCTVTDNSARYSGGVGTGTDNGGATNLTMTGCIIAGNHSPFAQDVGRQGGSFTSGGGNLIGATGHSFVDDWAASDLTGTEAAPLGARLAASGFYGGPVPTCPPLPGSPALDSAAAAPPHGHRPARSAACDGCRRRGRRRGGHRRG